MYTGLLLNAFGLAILLQKPLGVAMAVALSQCIFQSESA
jgi:protein-S-isoprenylcysteine O-methyltransferase Ste14